MLVLLPFDSASGCVTLLLLLLLLALPQDKSCGWMTGSEVAHQVSFQHLPQQHCSSSTASINHTYSFCHRACMECSGCPAVLVQPC